MSASNSTIPTTDSGFVDPGPYGYTPDSITCYIFLAIYGATGILHLIQMLLRPRLWWMAVFPVCALTELIGWGGRLWSFFDVYSDGFLMQICCLVIAPTFVSAGLYVLLGILIQEIAPDRSWLSHRNFKIVFITADILSLCIQAAGGGLAATASEQDMVDRGANIMLVGILVQLAVMAVYVVYFVTWACRARNQLRALSRPARRHAGWQFFGMSVCSFFIVLRGIYRSFELSDGFAGKIATNQTLFLFDAVPVSIAMVCMNIFHPRYFLTPLRAELSIARDEIKYQAAYTASNVVTSLLYREPSAVSQKPIDMAHVKVPVEQHQLLQYQSQALNYQPQPPGTYPGSYPQ